MSYNDEDYEKLSAQQGDIAEQIMAAIAANRRKLLGDDQEPKGETENEAEKEMEKETEKEMEKESEKESEKGRLFLITGSAGTGKSTLLRALLNKSKMAGYKSLVASAFAAAAANSSGQTMHHTFNIPVNPDFSVPVESTRGALHYDYFVGLDVLFIEEFSTCSNYMLSLTDERMRTFFKSQAPFGDRVVVFIGDPLQLKPPISDNETRSFKHRQVHVTLGPYFDSETWQACVDEGLVSFELKHNFRQNGDDDYARHLNNIRCARLSFDTCKKLLSRVLVIDPEEYAWPGGVMPTSLFGTLAQVAAANKRRFDRLAGEPVQVRARFWPTEGAARDLVKRANVEPSYELKEGCQVMLRANVCVSRGLCNGTRGVVSGFLWDEENKENRELSGVYISLPCGRRELVGRYDFCTYDKHTIAAQYSQIPLSLAWSMTIHKSQGLTISPLLVDIGATCFTDSQIYVALSRTTGWNSLFLKNIDFKKITVDPRVAGIVLDLLPDSESASLLREGSENEPQFQQLYDFDRLVRPDVQINRRRQVVGSSRSEETVFFVPKEEYAPPHVCSFMFDNSKNIIGVIARSQLHTQPFWSASVSRGPLAVSFEQEPFLRTLVYTFDVDESSETGPQEKRSKRSGDDLVRITFREKMESVSRARSRPNDLHFELESNDFGLVTSGLTQVSKDLSVNKPCHVRVYIYSTN